MASSEAAPQSAGDDASPDISPNMVTRPAAQSTSGAPNTACRPPLRAYGYTR